MALIAVLLAAVCAGPATAAVDPFYDSLLREGRLAFETGDWPTAAARLRLACFGLLDEPPLLTETLARLALAQDRSGDATGFRRSIQRLVEVDDRFSTYAVVPAQLRAELETAIRADIPAEFLAASTTFRHLTARTAPPAEDLTDLPPKRRRSALEERMAADPDNFRWPLQLAETELALGNHKAAAQAADDALRLDSGNQDALCVRGRARAELDQCAAAVHDLETCRKVYADGTYSLALLQCQVELERPEEARRILAALPENIRAERPIRRLEGRLPEAPAAEAPRAAPPTPTAASIATAEPPRELSPSELATLEEARDRLRSARSLDALGQALDLARSVADQHPGHREAQRLVGEIAYRASRWEQAVTYFERGGVPTSDEPRLLFYLAVAYWESGRPADAAEVLRRALPHLQRSAYVESYVDKILGGEG